MRPFSCSRSRCCTPKRCCSSTMISASVGEVDAFLEQRVRADDEAHFAGCDGLERAASRRARAASPKRAPRAVAAAGTSRGSCASAARPAARSAPSARPACRCLRRAPPRPRPRSSCRSPRRPAAAAPSGARRADPASTSPKARCCAPVSGNGSDARNRVASSSASSERASQIARRGALEQPQAQLMREQLLEGEPPLRRVLPGGQLIELRLARRAMHVVQRFLQRGQAQRREHLGRNPVAHRRGRELAQRLIDERAQPSLRDAFRAGIDRRQRLLERRLVAARRAGTPDARSRARAGRAALRRSSAGACRAPARSAARRRNRRSAA